MQVQALLAAAHTTLRLFLPWPWPLPLWATQPTSLANWSATLACYQRWIRTLTGPTRPFPLLSSPSRLASPLTRPALESAGGQDAEGLAAQGWLYEKAAPVACYDLWVSATLLRFFLHEFVHFHILPQHILGHPFCNLKGWLCFI